MILVPRRCRTRATGQTMTTAMPSEDPRPEMLDGHLYDYPAYYDLIFGSDCAAELSFLEACFERFTDRVVSRVFEPACGTGRLLYRLARRGYSVSGNDLNPAAVASSATWPTFA